MSKSSAMNTKKHARNIRRGLRKAFSENDQQAIAQFIEQGNEEGGEAYWANFGTVEEAIIIYQQWDLMRQELENQNAETQEEGIEMSSTQQDTAEVRENFEQAIAEMAAKDDPAGTEAEATETAPEPEIAPEMGQEIAQEPEPVATVSLPTGKKEKKPKEKSLKAQLADAVGRYEAAEVKIEDLEAQVAELEARLKIGKAKPATGSAKSQTVSAGPGRGGSNRRYELFGHSVTAVCRWMGRDGFTTEQARAAIAAQGIQCAIATIGIQVRAGAKGERGAPAELTAEQAEALRAYKTDAA